MKLKANPHFFGGQMGVPRAVQKAIAAFSAERLLSLPHGEFVAFLHNIEQALIPDAPDHERVTFWIACANQALDENDLVRIHEYCHRAGDLLYELQELSLQEFYKAFGAASLFKLEEALFATDEQPLEEALRRLEDFVSVFMETSSVDEVRAAMKVKSPLPVNPMSLLKEMRERVTGGNPAFGRKWLKILDGMLTDLIDEALAKNWQPPAPYGALLTIKS